MVLLPILGTLLVAFVLWDVFEVVVLPRRVQRTVRPARYFFFSTWRVWSSLARRIHNDERRENVLSFFGPLSLLMLFVLWAGALIFGYALIYLWSGPRRRSRPRGSQR